MTPTDAIFTLHKMRQTLKGKVEGTKRIRGMRKSEQAAMIADYGRPGPSGVQSVRATGFIA